MAYALQYQGKFKNTETDRVDNLPLDVEITINIFDKESGTSDTPTIVPLEMAATPVKSIVIDNSENKFTVFRPKSYEINVHSSESVGIETFINGGDSRYYVQIIVGTITYFFGYLSLADISEDFMPDPNTITLIANDGLGFLSDETLVDSDGGIPKGPHRIIDYLTWCLALTGVPLDIYVVMNIRHENATHLNDDNDGAGHFFIHEYLESLSFEGSDVGTMMNGKDVIERILGNMAYITQWQGFWFIKAVDEFHVGQNVTIFHFNATGGFVEKISVNPLKTIAVDLPLGWMNEDAVLSAERPVKDLVLTYNYEYPSETPCNIDFSRGTGSDPTGAANETIDYVPKCWDFLREGVENVDLDSAPFAGSTGVLRKRFEYNYEKDRYFVVGTAGGFRHYFKSQGIIMADKSKITIGFNWRNESDTGGTTANVSHMRLIGDDGTIYDWKLTTGGISSWVLKVATDAVFTDEWQDDISSIDDSEWQQISATSQPAPVPGTLYIRLLNDLSSPMRDFSGLTLTYIPLLNGSYQKYQGQTHSVTQDGNFKGKREDDVFVGDPPDRNIKGALLKRGTDRNIFTGTVSFGTLGQFEMSGDHRSAFQPYIGQTIIIDGSASNDQECLISSVSYSIIGNITTVVTTGTTTTELSVAVTIGIATFDLANRFYDSFTFPDGPPDTTYVHPYGELQVFDVWNQYNRVMRKIEGTIDGLQSDNDDAFGGIPDLIHIFVLSDTNPNVDNKIFMCLHFEQDYDLCEMKALLHEVDDSTIGRNYLGHSFKYITG